MLHWYRGKYQCLCMCCNIKMPGLSTGTVCNGSSNLLIDLASIFASSFISRTLKKSMHIIVWKPTKCVSGEERREERQQCTAAIQRTAECSVPIDFDDNTSLLTESA